jgi:phage FluMu gp28-like protein
LGFDVAASGQGDLAVFYIDEVKGSDLLLRALLSARTEDWNFLKTVLFFLLQRLPTLEGAGDETGLGRQICWEAASHYSRFIKVNFASKKHDLGFSLMNQLSVAQKRFPRSQQDIASDYFALRKLYTGTRWVFTETSNLQNPVSHCDIAWAGALATYAHNAHTQRKCSVGAAVVYDNGWFDGKEFHLFRPEHIELNTPAPPASPAQEFPLGCAFCAHRPSHFNPPPPRCKTCGIYSPKS